MKARCFCLILWLQVASFALFLVGFFPMKKPFAEVASPEDIPGVLNLPGSFNVSAHWLEPCVGQLVIVLIDALRADFVFSAEELQKVGADFGAGVGMKTQMEYLRQALRSGEAIGVAARASPPTVTLPRIKALTTGSIPGFVDVVLNFGSSALEEDSIIGQWHTNGRRINFFGDDTWIRLFPNHFVRKDGTTSFFVSDYTEVDDNVTRHLDQELLRNDWDITILHYLGLDHIGHLVGPSSTLVRPKLDEMEGIIKRINDSLHKKSWKENLPPLVIVMGDHGMSDGGSHGGASLSEILTPIVAIGPPLKHDVSSLKVVNQQDLVPTLAYLTGVPIPRNSFGTLIHPFVDLKYKGPRRELQQLGSLLYNARQVASALKKNDGHYASNAGYRQLETVEKSMTQANFTSPDIAHGLIEQLQFSLIGMSEGLEEKLVDYNLTYMLIGIAMHCATLMALAHTFCTAPVIVSWMSLLELIKIASLASTSFIEEQHQTAYFVLTTALFVVAYLLMKQSHSGHVGEKAHIQCEEASKEAVENGHETGLAPETNLLAVALALRLARTWNQTGDKWSHLPDFSDWLLHAGNEKYLGFLHALSLLMCVTRFAGKLLPSQRTRKSYPLSLCLFLITSYLMVLLHNLAEGNLGISADLLSTGGHREAQIVYLCSTLSILSNVIPSADKEYNCCEVLLDAFLPVALLLLPPASSILLPCQLAVAAVIDKAAVKLKIIPSLAFLLHWNVASAFYFYQGNSNSLASVNVSAGYTGLSSYTPLWVILLIALNTYSAQIVGLLFFFTRQGMNVVRDTGVMVFWRALELVFFLCLVTVMRYHLFVWTVFSPKLLYQGTLAVLVATVCSIISVISSSMNM